MVNHPCDGLTHIERPGSDYDASVTVVHMLCGASCVLFDCPHVPQCSCNDEPVPNLDWYLIGHGSEKATCPKCRELDHTRMDESVRVPERVE